MRGHSMGLFLVSGTCLLLAASAGSAAEVIPLGHHYNANGGQYKWGNGGRQAPPPSSGNQPSSPGDQSASSGDQPQAHEEIPAGNSPPAGNSQDNTPSAEQHSADSTPPQSVAIDFAGIDAKGNDLIFNNPGPADDQNSSSNDTEQTPESRTVAKTPIPVVTAAVPEPAAWAMMVMGFGLIGGAVRKRQGKASSLQRSSAL